MANDEQLLDYEPEVKALEDASNGKRFLNVLIDIICVYVVAIIVIAFFIVDGMDESDLFFRLVGSLILVSYYSIFEGLTGGKSIGKYITKTRVVTQEGETPTFINIVGRSFCRLIPFDALSFFGEKPGGWHDSISKTRVVMD